MIEFFKFHFVPFISAISMVISQGNMVNNTETVSMMTSDEIESSSLILMDNTLFEFFKSITLPAFWCCVFYTIMVLLWALIYFICKTIPSLHKCRHTKSSLGSVCDGSLCFNKFTYLLDSLNIITDITFALWLLSTSNFNNQYLYNIFAYISCGVAVIGLLLFFIKFKFILPNLYPYIVKWSINQPQQSKIGLFLQHQIMYDLFSASLQDSINAAIIFYIFTDLDYNIVSSDYNVMDKLLFDSEYNSWQQFYWLIRIKLLLCILFMFYKLMRCVFIECKCHYKSNNNSNDDDDDDGHDSDYEFELEFIHRQTGADDQSNRSSRANSDDKFIKQESVVSDGKWIDDIADDNITQNIQKMDKFKVKSDSVMSEEFDEENKYNDDAVLLSPNIGLPHLPAVDEQEQLIPNNNDKKIKKKQKKAANVLLKNSINKYGDVDSTSLYLGSFGVEYEKEWKKQIIKLIEENKDELNNKTMEPIMKKYVQNTDDIVDVVKVMDNINKEQSVEDDDDDDDDDDFDDNDDDDSEQP